MRRTLRLCEHGVTRRGGIDPKRVSAAEAVTHGVKSGDAVFVHTASAAPQVLVRALVNRAREQKDLRNVELVHLHTEGDAPYVAEEFRGVFDTRLLFTGSNMRKAVAAGRASYVPCFLSEIPSLIRNGDVRVNTAFITVSPPDRHGFVSLGPSVDVAPAAIEKSATVVAVINKHCPRTHGDGVLHISALDYVVEHDEPLVSVGSATLTDAHRRVAEHVAALVPDGACIQMGIGAVPDACLAALKDHKDIGVHTEMFSDGLIPLIEAGVITGARKQLDKTHLVSSFVVGSSNLYRYLDDNSSIKLKRSSYVNNPYYIKQNERVHAINTCVQIDLSGQVCGDSVGHRVISGFGGQLDFMRAARLSEGGKAIMALTSRTNNGEPRIVTALNPGAGVTTTRGHVHWVVTEYGAVNLAGKTIAERADLLRSIAHPDDRESLKIR